MDAPTLPQEKDITNGREDMALASPEPEDDSHNSPSSSSSEEKIEDYIIPYDPDELGFRRIVRNFTPSWFVVTMGTGGVSTLLYQIPYPAQWLNILSTIFFVLNIIFWLSFIGISCLRFTMYPELWGAMLRHPTQRLFLGTVPTGLATIINMIVPLCFPAWGQGMVVLAWVLWWINSVVAVFLCFYLTFIVINVQKADLSGMTPLWLLPVLPAVICSTTGGIIAPFLMEPQHQLWTLIISYVLWGIACPLALMLLVLYFYRLMVFEMLDKEVIVSVFLPLGPFGLGGYSLFLFGKDALTIFPRNDVLHLAPSAAEMIYVFGFIVALLMWGFGLVWLFLAIASICKCRKFPFNMGWWSFTFPLAVFALSTIQFGKELESSFFKVLGTVMSVIVFILWVVVTLGTVRGALSGKMFFAPCLGTDMKLQELKIKRVAARMTGAKAS